MNHVKKCVIRIAKKILQYEWRFRYKFFVGIILLKERNSKSDLRFKGENSTSFLEILVKIKRNIF